MNAPETRSSPIEPKSDPHTRRRAGGGSEQPLERWINRLKIALGLAVRTSFRESFSQALADDEGASAFAPEERAMLANILSLREVHVDDVMVPRADIDAVDIGISVSDLLVKFHESGHSRMPVFRETLDVPVGLVHIKDLLAYITASGVSAPESVDEAEPPTSTDIDLRKVTLTRNLSEADLVRNILFVPPSMPVTALLASMQAAHTHMALVIDEYGGTDGVVSLEDVLEMVVGDIEDEHDDDVEAMIVPSGKGIFLADARAALDDVAAAVGADFFPGDENDDIDTIGGVVYSLIGRIPVRGERIAFPGGVEVEVVDADPRRIKRLRIYRRSSASRESASDASP